MTNTPPDPQQPDPVQPGPPAATPPKYAAPLPPVAPAPIAPPAHWQPPQAAQPMPPSAQPPAQSFAQPGQPPVYPGQPSVGTPGYGQQPSYPAPGYGQQPPAPHYAQAPGYPTQPGFPTHPGYPTQPSYPGQPGAQGYPGYAPVTMATPGPGEPFDGAAHPDDLTRPLYGATIGQALSRFFKNYASFSGRASRSEFWWVALVFGGGWFALSFVVNILDTMSYNSSYGATSILQAIGGITLLVVGLGILIPSIAITWRRLHDANLAGPFYFLGFVFPIGGIILLILTVLQPKPEGRRFFRNM